MMRTKHITALVFSALLLAGCEGSPVYSSVKSAVDGQTRSSNNDNLLKLQIGMETQQVQEIMGDPEQSEAYQWGTVWLYRTARTSGVYGTEDSDFTPVVFSSQGILEGWGRNFFTAKAKKYEINIKQE